MTRPWTIGQRVRNEAEPSLGLGIVTGFPTTRSLHVVFPGAGEERTYNPTVAPLRRYELAPGQTARTRDGRTFRVERVEANAEGLLTYHGQDDMVVPELQLDDASASQDPLARLLEGELDDPEAFGLRARAWALRQAVLQQRCRGLWGGRVQLLPHQLATAYKVATREVPRVLLADEVGLGKTIEACLIFSVLRALGRADRVLVLTPASLVHQWLVELYRRFNEPFTVVGADDDPLDDAARLIAPLAWLLEPAHLEHALATPWDLVIVDEAHHLGWSRTQPTPAYLAVEALAARSQGLLLLTATPMRQGLETEYGLLRLVDPERFPDEAAFVAEHVHMREVADLARRLAHGEDVSAELTRRYPEARWDGAPAASLQQLIDRHGTGRVLVRNRRDKLGGFPGRQLHLTVLPRPESWKKVVAWPELQALEAWLGLPVTRGHEPPGRDDPRWVWVLALLQQLGEQKLVVMASTVDAVLALERHVRKHTGLKLAVFHEQLGLVERDRQAAYFADPEGAQLLISSEIGGEGRNFQFCHHLALVDLPLHPDALEQRIGRLDRIGQTETIQVHAAVIAGTPGEVLFAWHEAARLFEAPLTGGEHLMEVQARPLLEVMRGRAPREALLAETATVMARHKAEVQDDVDYLVDLNSFDQPLGLALAEEVAGADRVQLARTTSALLEHFGVVEEDMIDPRMKRVRPGHHMKVEAFPGLRADGYLATYDRELALAREDMAFLTPDHPLVEGALALLLDQAGGRASVGLWPDAPEPGIWLELLFLLEAVGPPRLGLPRFLPPIAHAVVLGLDGRPRELPATLRLRPLPARAVTPLLGRLQDVLPPLLTRAETAADAALTPRVAAAVAEAERVLGGEQARLEALRALGNVSAGEVSAHAAKLAETLRCLRDARVGLDAVRVVVGTA